MEITPGMLLAAGKAYEEAEGDPLSAALGAAMIAALEPVTRDRYKRWTLLEAMTIYAEDVRPKTYTLFDNAMRRTVGKYSAANLLMLMQLLYGQILHDMYTTAEHGASGALADGEEFCRVVVL